MPFDDTESRFTPEREEPSTQSDVFVIPGLALFVNMTLMCAAATQRNHENYRRIVWWWTDFCDAYRR